MSALAFFPWLSLPAPVVLGRFRLVPWRIGASLEPEPRVVDALLAPFQHPGGHPLESAVLVHLAGRPVTGELDRAEQAQLHLVADAVGFAALAQRRLFGPGPSLSGAQLAFVLRRFTGSDPRTLQLAVRRRDGTSWVAHDAALPRTRPPPVRPGAALEADWTLAAALLGAFAAPGGARLREAVVAFAAASGDAGGALAHELLSLATAFERLLEAGEARLPQALAAVLGPDAARARVPHRLATLRRLEASREPGRQPSASIVEAWARDLLRARDSFGGAGADESYWPPEAHLLVGSWVFPAAVRARLAAAGLRPVGDVDRKAFVSSPYLAALRNPFARRRSLAARDPHLWPRALEVAGRRLAQLQVEEVLARARGG